MGFFSTLTAPFTRSRKSGYTLDDLLVELASGRKTTSGLSVTWDNAMRVSTVCACVRVLSEGVAQVPLKVFRDAAGSKLPATDHPLYRPLHSRPNPVQTSFQWRETAMIHAALTGNHHSFINRGPAGQIELIPFLPGQVERAPGADVAWKVSLPERPPFTLPAASVFHLAGPSWDAKLGIDTIRMAREAIGLAMAVESHGSRAWSKRMVVPGVYSVEGKLLEGQYETLRKFLLAQHTGENSDMPMILDRSAKWTPTAMSNLDSQMIEERRMQVEEICRFFRVMPIMVGFTDKTATYASAEQMFLAHVMHTLAPWYTRFEQALEAQVLSEADIAAGYYPRFIAAGLLRGSMKDRSEYFKAALGAGGSPAWMTQDEVRALDELNPMGGAAARLPIATNVAPSGDNGGQSDRDPEPEPGED